MTKIDRLPNRFCAIVYGAGLCLFLIANSVNIVFAQDSVKIAGKILNRVSDTVLLSYNDNRIAFYPKEFIAATDKEGNFSMTFPVPRGIYMQADLVNGNKVAEMILHGGDNLIMRADAAHFDSTIHFEGTGSSVANFVALHKMEKGLMNKYTVKIKTAINQEPAGFLKEIEGEKKAELDFLEKNKQGLPLSFVKYWTAFFQYYNYFFIEQYPQIHEMVKKRKYTDTIPEINYTVLKELPNAFNDSLLQLPPYLLYLTGILDIKLKMKGGMYFTGTQGAQRLQDSVMVLGYKQMPDKSAEYFIAQNLYGRARSQEVAKTEQQLRKFKKRWPHSDYTRSVEDQLAITKRLAKGQPAPDIDIITPDGNKKKLSDLKGKVVYLSFWASWCRQCIGEMMAENKIKDLIKNKPLEFVYVSIDNDTTAGRQMTEKYKIEGTFTNASGGWNAREVKLFGVQALPAYFLIDEDGNFALQNTPTPAQSTQLILEIEKLLK